MLQGSIMIIILYYRTKTRNSTSEWLKNYWQPIKIYQSSNIFRMSVKNIRATFAKNQSFFRRYNLAKDYAWRIFFSFPGVSYSRNLCIRSTNYRELLCVSLVLEVLVFDGAVITVCSTYHVQTSAFVHHTFCSFQQTRNIHCIEPGS